MRKVEVNRYGYVLSGKSHCFRSATAALAQSRKVTTTPGVTSLDIAGEYAYLANGDCWINSAGKQGQHHYGRRGRLVELVELP